MALRRASCQKSVSLEGFYQELASSTDSVSSSAGEQMLSLLQMLSEVCTPFDVWGLTSLAHLWLLAADDWRSTWLVCVTAFPGLGYRIQYRMTDIEAPWPEALVEGMASDEATACRLILIAMERSGGWRRFSPERDSSGR
jgi:hypothetical protein